MPAKALYLVIFISFIVSVILLLLISNSYFNQIEVLKYQHLKKLVDSNNNYINRALVNEAETTGNVTDDSEELSKNSIETKSTTEQWGGFSVLSVQSEWKELKVKKKVLTGNYLFNEERTGLYLADKGKYLSIAGNTELAGTTYLPALGIRSVYIDGVPYKGESLVYGNEKKSKDKCPDISENLLNWISNAHNKQYGNSDTLGSIRSLYRESKIQNDFSGKTLVFESNKEISLNNIELNGKIVVHSDSAIYIGRNLESKNIIAIAPIIIVEPGFSGSIQLFAKDTLLIDKKVHLKYPSFAVIYNQASSGAYAFIEEEVIIEGGVLCKAGMGDGEEAELILEEKSVVHGVVYCSGDITHKGEVYGSMYLNKFVLKTKRGYYENHLLNAVIDADRQMPDMVVPRLFDNEPEQGIIEWL